MKISRILIVFILFLITWKETLNQQITSNNQLDKRDRRYHKSDHDDFLIQTPIKQIKNEREKEKVPATESIISSVKKDKSPQERSSPLYYSKQNPARKIIASRNLRLKPLNPTNKKILEMHKPYVVYVKNHEIVDRHTDQEIKRNKINDTTLSSEEEKVVEKEVVVEKNVDTKENSTSNLVKLLEDTVEINPEYSMIEKSNSDPQPQNNESQETSKNSEESDKTVTCSITPEEQQLTDKKILSNETIIGTLKPITEKDKSSLIEAEPEVKCDLENKEEDSAVVTAVIDPEVTNTTKSEDAIPTVSKKVDIAQPRKHTCLDVIMNDLPISRRTFDGDSIHTLPQEKDKCDEKDNVIIRNNNYQEVLEISCSPQASVPPQVSTAPENIAAVPYYNNYQTPYSNYQEPKPSLNLNYNNQDASKYPADEQRVDQIDGATVVSYNNYYKLPTNFNSNSNGRTDNYPNLSTYTNRDNGYQAPAKPNLSFESNVWNNNRDFGKEPSNDVIKRIWRNWKNIEYDIKSKNIMKQLNLQQFYNNLANQNDAENQKLIQRRKAIGSNYY